MSDSNDIEPPAILGGSPIRPEGPPAWPPALSPERPEWPEWENVALALRRSVEDGSWGRYHGPNTSLLVERLSSYFEVEFVELCCSGTFAVELALRALQIGDGDEVILSDYDFIGNFNDIVAVGARPVLIDVDPENWNLAPERIVEAIGPKTRAILASHLHGGMVPMKRVVEIAREHGLSVIEDACQTPGATVEGRKAGTWGDVGVISFGGSKLLSAGRGGAMLTASPAVKQRAQLYCNRGNHAYPLSELQATVILPQLAHLDHRNQQRASGVSKLAEALGHIPGFRSLKNRTPSTTPGYYKLGFQYIPREFGDLPRDAFVRAAQAEGVDLKAGYSAFHKCRSSRRFRKHGELESAAEADAGMVILHHPALVEGEKNLSQVGRCVEKLRRWASSIADAR
jgi:dTDP-4-amino-4,6-dideoxygalactose transaminase